MLKLAHHKHSFKPLPHHHTSFRGIFLLLLVVGVVMVSMHRVAHADFMDLNAKISGPLPTIPAEITSPVNGGIFDNPNLLVSGTCETLDPSSIIIIQIDGQMAGSTTCQGGNFSLTVTLPEGTHLMVARTSNTTEDFGPDSDPVQVTYKPKPAPAAAASTGNTAGGSKSNSGGRKSSGTGSKTGSCIAASPLSINNAAGYLTYGRFAPAKWEFSIGGGCVPYHTTITWGDGTSDSISITDNDIYEAEHAYTELKPFYVVNLIVTGADKQTVRYSIVAVTPYIPDIYAGGALKSIDEPFILTFEGTILRAYLAYLALLIVVGLAWYDKHIKRVRIAGVHVFPKHPEQ